MFLDVFVRIAIELYGRYMLFLFRNARRLDLFKKDYAPAEKSSKQLLLNQVLVLSI